MASIALDSAYRRISVREFMEMDFGDARAELDDGIIYMMAGGSEQHARIAANILISLGPRLRGSGCRAYGSDFATQTGEATVRLPDVSVHCGNPSAPENRHKRLLGDPKVVFEVLSPSTASLDQKAKLEEYRSLEGMHDVVLVDPDSRRIRHVRRNDDGDWVDGWLAPGSDVMLHSLGIMLPEAEVFTDD
jgi:Uma2 family endonuclease